MEYRHTPPTLEEVRKFRRRVAEYRKKNGQKKAGFFGTKHSEGSGSDFDLTSEELIHNEIDVILAHLENQNEILLQLIKRIERG